VPMKGLVLDLRNDPGGLLNGAVAVSAAFLQPDSLVVYTDGRTPDAKMKLKASPQFYLRNNLKGDYLKNLPPEIKTVPMVTLVNGGSASASEIVAGALQDHKRSVIMGTQTFGKGSVQTILPLGNDTAIKLTTARYFTPKGQSIQAKGITPDILAESAEDDSGRLREADLEGHLPNSDEEKKAIEEAIVILNQENETAEPNSSDNKDKINKEPIVLGSDNDLLLKQALNHFKGITTPKKDSKELDNKGVKN
jgi:carboxyl-terminal processing protease